jgi:hypothetical protein
MDPKRNIPIQGAMLVMMVEEESKEYLTLTSCPYLYACAFYSHKNYYYKSTLMFFIL